MDNRHLLEGLWKKGFWRVKREELPTILSDEEKCAIIAVSLDTEEGRTALAQSMVEAIRGPLEYSSVGRALFPVETLPQGALARYDRDVNSVAQVIGPPSYSPMT